jgi:hypothetical protein
MRDNIYLPFAHHKILYNGHNLLIIIREWWPGVLTTHRIYHYNLSSQESGTPNLQTDASTATAQAAKTVA